MTEQQNPCLFDLPEKTYFKIGEVAEVVGVKPYVLRYWESEFKSIRPTTALSRHRMYTRDDIKVVLQIKHLLYEELYTIAGARKRLQQLLKSGALELQDSVDEVGGDDPLSGTERVALEQQLEQSKAHLDRLTADRDEAMDLARTTTAAIAEVDAARMHAEQEAEELKGLLQQASEAHREATGRLEAELGSLRAQVFALEAERDTLAASTQTAASQAEWPSLDEAALVQARRVEAELRGQLVARAARNRRLLETAKTHLMSLISMTRLDVEPVAASVATPSQMATVD